ncbi:MAG: thermonuclease family protein [Bacillota bacterium]|nr:thermonuclease family protein [Bacillota bacterium]
MSKKAFNISFIIILFAIVLISGLSGCRLFYETGPDQIILHRVKITRVIDGDTAYARFADGSEEKVRFIGVDAPEINHPTLGKEEFGPEAEVYTRTWIEGKTIWLEYDRGERDQYDRLLAYLWLEIPEEISDQEIRAKMFNAQLLIEGYAVQVIFEPNVKYVNYFSAYEAEARENNKGLWGLEE